ncbi:hypothetical protein OEZ85_010471 [Tetradesmus obliquus]|uniref:Helicase ATP-binding domain-containing protein n=1 Tax=Tetradesmus obliquus TaxID=3088 RepID=A0ABY8TMD5_TETOB|nr:hypothetical protein OEZ85_010471 [Tetradesmus obliquus]
MGAMFQGVVDSVDVEHQQSLRGKSSRVPQLLQQELAGPILCTQPRRLAVVAIARHVAELTGAELGRGVGFRIGQKSVASSSTKILFTTAGLLLEELRANGAAALRRYSCLIIDELHERSVENDLLLACLHAMMVPGAAAAAAAAAAGATAAAAAAAGPAELPSLKLVLMSATANVERYKQYFKLPGEHVSLIQCDLAARMASAIGQWLETVKVVYLESVVAKLLAGHRNSSQHSEVLAQHKAGAITPQAQVRQRGDARAVAVFVLA